MSYRNNITMIDDLPDISDFEDSGSMGLSMIPDSAKYQKFLKNTNNNNLPANSGMGMSMGQDSYKLGYHNVNQGSYIDNMPNSNMSSMYPPKFGSSGGFAPESQMIYEPFDNLNCREIARHINNCEICSKIYNKDNTFHIILICVLTIICILLLKRILDV